MAGREYHYPSDDRGHAGGDPAFAKGVLARSDQSEVLAYPVAAARAFLPVGIEVPDEWVFGFQGAGSANVALIPLPQLPKAQNDIIFSKNPK